MELPYDAWHGEAYGDVLYLTCDGTATFYIADRRGKLLPYLPLSWDEAVWLRDELIKITQLIDPADYQ